MTAYRAYFGLAEIAYRLEHPRRHRIRFCEMFSEQRAAQPHAYQQAH